MSIKQVGGVILQITVVVVILAFVIGQLLGQPVLLSFVETGSMEPTIEAGDGFVAIPPELAGSLGEGDVIVFEAETIEEGGLTTHRIVGETDNGFITQGDANPFTDQDSGEPLVQEPEIKAVVWQPGGDVITIPFLGSAIMGIQSVITSLQLWLAQLFGTGSLLGLQGMAYLLFVVSLVLYVLSVYFESDRRHDRNTERSTGTTPRTIIIALTVLVIAGATAAMVIPADTESFNVVSAEFDSESPDVIEQGTSESLTHEIHNTGFVSKTVFFESGSSNVAVSSDSTSLPARSSANASVTVTAPPETGHYTFYLKQYRYLNLLPTSVIESLYQIHPWAPLVVINAVLGIPLYGIGIWLLGSGRLRSRNRSTGSWLS